MNDLLPGTEVQARGLRWQLVSCDQKQGCSLYRPRTRGNLSGLDHIRRFGTMSTPRKAGRLAPIDDLSESEKVACRPLRRDTRRGFLFGDQPKPAITSALSFPDTHLIDCGRTGLARSGSRAECWAMYTRIILGQEPGAEARRGTTWGSTTANRSPLVPSG